MNEDDSRMIVSGGCLTAAISFTIGALVMALMFTSCTTTEYVPVIEKNTEHHWHTDTVRERDSIFTDRQTTIMQLDSAAMARYGIQLRAAERAWLVQSKELEQRLRELEHISMRGDTVRDSIPVPYPVEKKVARELTFWQEARMRAGDALFLSLGLLALLGIARWRKWQL